MRRSSQVYLFALWAFTAHAGAAHAPQASSAAVSQAWFEDVSERVGVRFSHFNGMSGDFFYPEVVGAGVAFLDYDNDGDLDLYLVQGKMLGPLKKLADALIEPPAGELRGLLLRNESSCSAPAVSGDTSQGERSSTEVFCFVDVTEQSGILADGYGMGVATGDIDNDGWVDLYLTHFGANQMFRNQGDGTFSDVTEQTGTGDARWGTSASFVDFDRDGWLDLMVGNYLDFSYRVHKVCFSTRGEDDYCHPSQYRSAADVLYRNRGDGTFEDVSLRALVSASNTLGSALGVIADDFNDDGWPDLYVANDAMPNHLWLNQGDGTLANEALLTGTALNARGAAEASMGVDAADFDRDGDLDLFLTHLRGETNTLYTNQDGFFRDRTGASGLAAPSWPRTGFGTRFADFDNDGLLDLVVVNGAVAFPPEADRTTLYPLNEPNQLFRGDGRRFEDVSAAAGGALGLSKVSRGLATGDVDNDGDVDLLITNNSGPARLLLNRVGADRPWISLRLERTGAARIGARVVQTRSAAKDRRTLRTDGSYASASDPRLFFSGGSGSTTTFEVRWPGGGSPTPGSPAVGVQRWTDLPPNRHWVLRPGER